MVKKVKKVTPKTVKSTKVVKNPAEIIKSFQELIGDAERFNGTSYKRFHRGILKHGPEMLGITKAILEELEKAIKVINNFNKEAEKGSKDGNESK
jgi:hypothetical protein